MGICSLCVSEDLKEHLSVSADAIFVRLKSAWMAEGSHLKAIFGHDVTSEVPLDLETKGYQDSERLEEILSYLETQMLVSNSWSSQRSTDGHA